MYKIEFVKSAEKALLSLPDKTIAKIFEAIEKLGYNPFPPGYKKLRGYTNRYRIRAGDYRVLYIIENDKLVILIIKVGHRKDVYE